MTLRSSAHFTLIGWPFFQIQCLWASVVITRHPNEAWESRQEHSEELEQWRRAMKGIIL